MTRLTAIVVVSYGSHRLLETHLARLEPGADATVVVVDNWSDATERRAVEDLTRRHGWELVAMPGNGGFGSGVNAGARRAVELGADVVVTLNPDLEISGHDVRLLADAAREEPRSMISPLIRRPDGRPWFSGGTLDRRTGRTGAHGGGAAPDWLSGACLAMSAALFTETGGFDDDFFMYWEDVDLSERVLRAGGSLRVTAEVTAVHDPGGTQSSAGPAKSDLYYRHNCRGRLLFAARHLGRADRARWVATAPAYAREVVLRGGRRQLLRSPAPVLHSAAGTLEGIALAISGGPRRRPTEPGRARRLLVAHPSPDLYGSDRQLVETVIGAIEAGWRVQVVLPADGPLRVLLQEAGAVVAVTPFPVLRKALLRPARLLGLVGSTLTATIRLARGLRRGRPDVVLVNTITIPVWLLAARLARTPVVCHVHEAEEDQHRVLRTGLAAPLLLARRVIANSAAARRALTTTVPRLGSRIDVIHNGVAGPSDPAAARHEAGAPWRLAMVGRLSPRKGTDVALDALGLLSSQGLDVRLALCGTPFEGYEWYERELRERAGRADLEGRVDFLGYVDPTWPVLAASDVVVVPSRAEPFGNTAVEAMLARRPLVASRVQGLAEVVSHERTGLLVEPDDPVALADAVARLLGDDGLRAELAEAGLLEARSRFTTDRYRAAMAQALARTVAADRLRARP